MAINTMALNAEANAARRLIEALGELANDGELVEDTIEGETDLKEIVSRALRRIAYDEAMVAASKQQQTELAARANRFKDRTAAMRDALVVAMDTAGLRKLELPEATISVRAGSEAVRILDEDALPADFLRTVTKTSPDRKAIGNALKAGEEVPGAVLSNAAPSLAIRRT